MSQQEKNIDASIELSQKKIQAIIKDGYNFFAKANMQAKYTPSLAMNYASSVIGLARDIMSENNENEELQQAD